MATTTKETLVNFRQRDKDKIIASLHPGHMLQVCGPPMVGKSTLVDQAIDCDDPRYCFHSHKFMCENKFSYQGVLNLMAEALGLQPASASSVNEKLILSLLASTFGKSPKSHHILVFHKCEGLQYNFSKTDGQDDLFIGFLCQIIHLLCGAFKMSVVLTSCKQFSLKGKNTDMIEIGVLNFWDITTILQHYAPSANVISYASICANTMPFPAAVRLFAEEFLADAQQKQPPEVLENNLSKNENFLSMVFGRKVGIVEMWIPSDILNSIVLFCHSLGSSFSEDHLKCVTGQNRFKWTRLFNYLRRNHLVWSLPGTNRLVVHPLLVYYWMQCRHHNRMVLQGKWYDHSSIRYTEFLCRLLQNTVMNIETHNEKDLMYGCLIQEWPHIRHMIEMTLSCNENICKTFLKTAISARGIMLKCFNTEALAMYQALYDTPETYFTPSERGMIEALLGHCKASTAVLAKGGTWKQAEDFLDSAIIKLRKHGPPFALMWAISRKGIILSRQGKYKESQMCFKAAKRVTVIEASDPDLESMFGVSKLQVMEEKITRDIYMATALIFLGQNDLAQEILQDCLEDIQNGCEDHQELATLLNSLGLIQERGHGDRLKAVELYQASFIERLKRAKFGRELLLVPLNNIGMIYLRLGKLGECKKHLKEALNIRRDLGWVHAHTALTLTHMGVLNMKCGDFTQAFKNTQEADRILQQILSVHDTRLRINNTLGHLSQLFQIAEVGHQYEDVKPEKSAIQYFEFALEIASRITGNFSDDGYHHMLIAHEHAMLLALGNSKEEYNKHKNAILPYFQISQGVGRKVFIPNEKIPNHMDLYSYFSMTNYEDIDKHVFVSHLSKACEFCQIINPSCSAEKLWCGDGQIVTDYADTVSADPSAVITLEKEETTTPQLQMSDQVLSQTTPEKEEATSSQLQMSAQVLSQTTPEKEEATSSQLQMSDQVLSQTTPEKEEAISSLQMSDQVLSQITLEKEEMTASCLHVFVPLPVQTASERMDDVLDNSDSQMQTDSTDLFGSICVPEQMPLSSYPGQSLSLKLLKSEETQQDIHPSNAAGKHQFQQNKQEEQLCSVAVLNVSNALSLSKDKYQLLTQVQLKQDVSDSTKLEKNISHSDYMPAQSGDIRLKSYDEYRKKQQFAMEKREIILDNSDDKARSVMHFTRSDNFIKDASLLDNRKYHNANTINPNLITVKKNSIKDYVDNNNEITREYHEDNVILDKAGLFDQFESKQDLFVDNYLDPMFSHSLSLKDNHEFTNELSAKSKFPLKKVLDARDNVNQNYRVLSPNKNHQFTNALSSKSRFLLNNPDVLNNPGVNRSYARNQMNQNYQQALSPNENHEIKNEPSSKSNFLLNNPDPRDLRDQINQNHQQGLAVASSYQNSPNSGTADMITDNKHLQVLGNDFHQPSAEINPIA